MFPRFQGGLGSDVLRRVLAYVEANLGQRISLEQLASLAGVSRFHFARQFRITIGQSPMKYVRRVRIERAKAMLRDGDTTIARLAATLGFADQSHFTRTFSRFIGVSPKSFAAGQIERAAEPQDRRNRRAESHRARPLVYDLSSARNRWRRRMAQPVCRWRQTGAL